MSSETSDITIVDSISIDQTPDINRVNILSDERVPGWEISRFQDLETARRNIEASVMEVLPNYKDSNIIIVGVCAGNGILEHAAASILQEQGITDLQIVPTDILPKAARFPKTEFPEHWMQADALHVGELRDQIIDLCKFPENEKPTKLLVLSRAWHHYFPYDKGAAVFESVSNLLEAGESFIDVPSSGSRPFLDAMVDLHRLIGKSYSYHDKNSYMDVAGMYFRGITYRSDGTIRIPRSLKTDFAARYSPDIAVSGEAALRGQLKFYKYIFDNAKVGDSTIHSDSYKLTYTLEEELPEIFDDLRAVGNINGQIHSFNEIKYIYDTDNTLTDIIATYTYPPMICTK